jgi:hypothetical protein
MSITDEERIPPSIREAVRAAAEDPSSFSAASRLFVDDVRDSHPADDFAEDRLERAVARATLEAWGHGLGSAAGVRLAYAAIANASRIRRARNEPVDALSHGSVSLRHPRAEGPPSGHSSAGCLPSRASR